MDTVEEIKKDGFCQKLSQTFYPSILGVCDTVNKYSCWLMTLLMTTALILWLMKALLRDVDDGKEATVIYSSSTTAMAESEDGSEETFRHGSRVKIPVRDNNAFRIRQMYSAKKMGRILATQQQKATSASKK